MQESCPLFYIKNNGSLVTISKVKRLEAYCEATRFYLKQELIENNHRLLTALQKRLNLIEKTRPYFQVVDSLKQDNCLNIFF